MVTLPSFDRWLDGLWRGFQKASPPSPPSPPSPTSPTISSLHHAKVARLEKAYLANCWELLFLCWSVFGCLYFPSALRNSWHFCWIKMPFSSDFIPGFFGKHGLLCGSPPAGPGRPSRRSSLRASWSGVQVRMWSVQRTWGILDDLMEDIILNLIDLLNGQRFIRWLFGIHDFHVDLF